MKNVSGQLYRAVTGLKFASKNGHAFAHYYLAHVFAVRGAHGDNGAAILQCKKFVDKYRDVDPYEDRLAPFVSSAMVNLANYWRQGVSDQTMNADTQRARGIISSCCDLFQRQ